VRHIRSLGKPSGKDGTAHRAPERLRLLGLFGAYLDVELQNGKAFAVTLEHLARTF
jgi:hypothetical protein